MSLTGFAYEFLSKFLFFSGFGYLSVYLCLWLKIWFFAGVGFLQIVREICLAIFEVVARPSGALKVSFVVWSNIGVYSMRILL